MRNPDPIREQSLERSLPNSSTAEAAIIGGILLDNGLISQAIELLRPEDFYVPSHRRIFLAMIGLFERGCEINPILIGEELKKENALESVGGISFITNLTYGLPHSTNIAHYAKVVRGKAFLRDLVRAANKITQEALEQEDEPETIGANANVLMLEVTEQLAVGKKRSTRIKPVAESILDKIQAMEGRGTALTGLTSGFEDLDRLTSGWQPQDLILLAARPSQGKTSLALMLAQNAALQTPGAVVGIYSLEMSKEALVMRMLCQQANIDHQRFRNGFLSRAEWTQIGKALNVLVDPVIVLDDSPGLSVLDVRSRATRLKIEHKRLDLIVVDYLQLMSGAQKRYDSENVKFTEISNGLKMVAKELDVPLVALSQLSRAPEKRSDPRPQLADLRGSGSLEQDADTVAFIYNPTTYKSAEDRDNMPDDEKNVAEIIVAKQRNGPTDVVKLLWTPSSMRFDNLFKEQMGFGQ